MGSTPTYGLPYPELTDPPDGPAQIKALADKIELWKNGFTVPKGAIIAGNSTDVSFQGSVQIPINIPPDIGEMRLIMPSAKTSAWMHYFNGAEAFRLAIQNTGEVFMRFGGVYRPIAFAMWGGQSSVSTASSVTGQVTVTMPSSRFTVAPLLFVTSKHSTYMACANPTGQTTTAAIINVRNVDNVAANSSPIGLDIMALQMTPGAAIGREVRTGDGWRIATCHTEDCENVDQAIDIHPDGGESPITCGPCGQPISDVVPA